MANETWFLLFDGESPDGRGSANYAGRTTDVKKAVWHFRKISGNPYSTGYVQIVTDNTYQRATEEQMRRLFKEASDQSADVHDSSLSTKREQS